MKSVLRWTLRIVAVLLVVALLAAGYFLLIDGRAPAKRPDLVRLPEGMPEAPSGYPTMNAVMLSLLLGRLDVVDPETDWPVPDSVEEDLDIEYGKVGGTSLKLDLYSPKNLMVKRPGLIFIHGGGWKKGHRSDYKYYTNAYAEKGYVVATISYRFLQEAKFPGCVEDAKCAVRWMRANADKLHVDPEKIAVIGGSAGGHLSLMTGYTSDVPKLEGTGGHAGVSSHVAAVIDFYGPTDCTTAYARVAPEITGFIGASYTEKPEAYQQASPLFHLDKDDPPTLVLQGTIDALVPVEQSDMLVEKLQELGIDHYYARIDGWPHTMDASLTLNAYAQKIIDAFLVEQFGPLN